MPIPVITDHFAAQVVFRGKTGQPEDVYTNTFYFRNDGMGINADEVADALLIDLGEFYNVSPNNVVGGIAIATGLSGQVIEANAELRVYDLGDPAPRYPKIRQLELLNLSSSVMPSEVAVCLSYVAGENQPRSRGRIYIGPLGHTVVTPSGGRAVVSTALQLGMLGAAKRLWEKNGHGWSIYSTADQEMKLITGAWVDNAFDTQRRRGEKATVRHTIGTYLGQSGTPAPAP